MADPLRPWADLPTLTHLLADMRQRLMGRALFRTVAGVNWVRLHLEDDERTAIWLTWIPGANLVFETQGTVDPTFKSALPLVRRHPLAGFLKDATLDGMGMFQEDKIAAFRFLGPDNKKLYLLHQMFGSRGNTVLLDEQSTLLWSRHRPPGKLLSLVPGSETWNNGEAQPGAALVSRLAQGHLATRLTSAHLQQYETALSRGRRATERLVANLQQDFERADKSETYRRKAEALAANLHTLKQGESLLETADLRDGHLLSIALNPALSPSANMENWFRRARKAEKGRDIILARLEEATAHADQFALATDRLEEIANSHCQELECLAALIDWHTAHAALLPTTGTPSARGSGHAPEEPSRPFRRYMVDDKYEVWIGRNNKENDQLTHRASHSKDIWFHAQGVPGSHVILRTQGKPEAVAKAVIVKAACLAALNSKAKHSSLVPVIYTERRYVRKPRKSPPGMATCLREKSIFVEPGIPAGVRPF